MIPLTMASAGETYTVVRISGRDEVRQHLGELGFVPGQEVGVVTEMGGNVILSLKQSRIALDKTMTNRIMVE
ncbi:MAG: ferrous iron transport protein A [Oscillospiraceae bacterium]|nr:ferrous iron transport protein A [Oscillospiraceae bacterium]